MYHQSVIRNCPLLGSNFFFFLNCRRGKNCEYSLMNLSHNFHVIFSLFMFIEKLTSSAKTLEKRL